MPTTTTTESAQSELRWLCRKYEQCLLSICAGEGDAKFLARLHLEAMPPARRRQWMTELEAGFKGAVSDLEANLRSPQRGGFAESVLSQGRRLSILEETDAAAVRARSQPPAAEIIIERYTTAAAAAGNGGAA